MTRISRDLKVIAMKVMWNPWRYEYIRQSNERKGECLFCKLQKLGDEEALIVYRGNYSFVVLNAYPYNSGHVMIAPYRHAPDLTELEDEVAVEIANLLKKSIRALREALSAEGFNIGANIGRVAGAGVPDHFHVHVVPRWVGDSNFMAIVAGVKPLPLSLRDAYEMIRRAWAKVN
ncbi:MAG: HIT domain-containing protein [Desulfurococcaceae archaeon]